ncbi:MAG: DUF507 family protein [Deltaproteobacteria bacterium]|nr:DUF507 family protein [Deltaproteobacteria bacterium]
MNLTDDRINHLSHLVLAGLKKGGGAKIPDETAALNGIKKALRDFTSLLETLDDQIRQKIASLKRGVPEGSREWDVLYRQYFDEAMAKKGLSR